MREEPVKKLMRHMEATLDLKVAAEPLSYWASLPLCVIDAVWSIQSKYETPVLPLVDRFCRSHNPPWDGESHPRPTSDVRPTIQDFIEVLDQRLASGETYETLFRNMQRTSARGGILKAEAIHLFAKALLASGINNYSDLRDINKLTAAATRVTWIPGQGSGITFTYFLMLAGEEDFVKSDTHIRRFVGDALALDWSQLVPADQAAEMVTEAAARFAAASYPTLTPVSLDYAIWNYQRKQTKPSPCRA